MATDRARKRWVTKLIARTPPPCFFPRLPPTPLSFSTLFSSNRLREGNVMDFIKNNRRVGELRPAQDPGLCSKAVVGAGAKCICSSWLWGAGGGFPCCTPSPPALVTAVRSEQWAGPWVRVG